MGHRRMGNRHRRRPRLAPSIWKTIMTREQISRCFVLAALVCVSGCVGAFMWDSSSRGGGSSRFPFLRWPELTAAEQQAGCFFTEWTPGQTVLWADAGGLLELRCPDASVPLGVRITRSCVYGTPPPPVQNPVKKGVYDKTGLLIGCRR